MSADDSELLILSPLALSGSNDQGDRSYSLFPDRRIPTLDEESIETLSTPHGHVKVAREGNPTGPAFITFHDLGLNHLSNYKNFFNGQSMSPVLSHFCIYHINAPGQEPGAAVIPPDAPYPTMEQLSESVEYVCHHYGISSCIALGSGLGANIVARLAWRRPKLVEGVILINCDLQSAGWLEWGYHKVSMKNLGKAIALPDPALDFLIWFHFGKVDGDQTRSNVRLAASFKQYLQNNLHPANLAKLMDSYVKRNNIKLAREIAANGKTVHGATRTLKMPVLNMVGEQSPHVDATVVLNGKLDPTKCTWMKIREAGMVLEEQPEKVSEAINLFLQGLGFTLRKPKPVLS